MVEGENVGRIVIYGVDFSGAKDAGNKIWITECTMEGNILQVEKCTRASEFLKAGSSRDKCITSLRKFIVGKNDSIFGIDFPFGLPNEVLHKLFDACNWKEFVHEFAKQYSNPETFKKECLKVTTGKELKRDTDKDKATPFSPYNLRLYKQTYFGIHDILAPLIEADLVCVLPMQSAVQGKPCILEICPASTLKNLEERLKIENLYTPYKGRDMKFRDQRLRILDALKKTNRISLTDAVICAALNNEGGDAIDSIVAAYATFCGYNNFSKIDNDENYLMEGYVFA